MMATRIEMGIGTRTEIEEEIDMLTVKGTGTGKEIETEDAPVKGTENATETEIDTEEMRRTENATEKIGMTVPGVSQESLLQLEMTVLC